MQEGKRSLPEDPLNDDFIDFYEDVDSCEKVPAKKASKEVQRSQLKDLCHKLDKEHLSTYAVGCSFSVVEEDILCIFCSATLKTGGLGISTIHQKITVHCERLCQRSNIYSTTSKDDRISERFADVELIEIKAIRLLNAMAPGHFKIVSDSSSGNKKVAVCLVYDKSLNSMLKGCDLKTLAISQLSSQAHFDPKRSKQTSLLALFPVNKKASSHGHMDA